ncbi:MAG: SDR family NAD(P)-dependent oxidoreductase [Alphaproteobacteria bacterium]|nr:SDR family NAD(P)-dependent oxidoreductase [Alphaproteobacteria bacterium]
MKRTAVITGGTGGLGLALDRVLRRQGWYTVLVDLPGAALDEIESLPERLILGCDLTDGKAMRDLCNEIRRVRPAVDLVIYNAGVTQIGAFSDISAAAHRDVFEINYFAAVNMAREFLMDIRSSKGTHLAISSVAGFSPLLNRTAYAASKHALEGFFKSLRTEERPYGVSCLIAAPSFVATNTGNPQTRPGGIARPGSAQDGIDYMSPEVAAKIIVNGYNRRHAFIPVGRVALLSYLINRLSPALFAWVMNRQFTR